MVCYFKFVRIFFKLVVLNRSVLYSTSTNLAVYTKGRAWTTNLKNLKEIQTNLKEIQTNLKNLREIQCPAKVIAS